MKEYKIKTKEKNIFGDMMEYTRTTYADSLEQAIDNFYIHLKNFKWTKDQIRKAII